MSKLLALREWLHLNEAALYLQKALNESIDKGDLYRLAMDGHLKLSMHFIKGTKAWAGEIKLLKETRKETTVFEHTFMSDGGVKISDTEVFVGDNSKVVNLFGIFDLPMQGHEYGYIEEKYYHEIYRSPFGDYCGPNYERSALIEGTFVTALGKYYSIVEKIGDDLYCPTDFDENNCELVVRRTELDRFIKTMQDRDNTEDINNTSSSCHIQPGHLETGAIEELEQGDCEDGCDTDNSKQTRGNLVLAEIEDMLKEGVELKTDAVWVAITKRCGLPGSCFKEIESNSQGTYVVCKNPIDGTEFDLTKTALRGRVDRLKKKRKTQ